MEPLCFFDVGGDNKNPQSLTDTQHRSTEER